MMHAWTQENCLLQNEEGLPHPLLKICDFGYSKADFRSAAKSQVCVRACVCACVQVRICPCAHLACVHA